MPERPAVLLAALVCLLAPAPARAAGFDLTLLHTNDVHARVDEVTDAGGFCTPEDAAAGDCLGGYPRLVTAIRERRAAEHNVLVLDAGDVFQGSLFYTRFKSEALKPYLNRVGYDAMTLGNHEFDDGVPELARFLDGLAVPVVTANLDVAREPRLRGKWSARRVVEVGGWRVGVVGLTTKETPAASSPGPTVAFGEHAAALRREVAALRAEGIDTIIALTHVGLAEDRRLAATVDGVDVFVGGHSHSLLTNGADERRVGPYPVVVTTPSGAPALVVQAYTAGLFLGELRVTFDEGGVPVRWSGDARPMDGSVAKDPETQRMVEAMAGPLAELRARRVGEAAAPLDGDRASCRQRECTLGNLIADAMLAGARKEGASIALMNGGGIRQSIAEGPVTLGDVLEVLPFSNTLATFTLTGAEVREALEHGVGRAEDMGNEGTGRFPQVAGLRFAWDAAKPVGRRVVRVEVREGGGFAPLDPGRTYTLVSNDFLRKGGDGYDLLRDRGRDAYDAGANLEDVLVAHLRALGAPAAPRIEGRITRVE